MSPPIIINENELFACSNIIINVFKQLENLHQDYLGPHETRYNFPNLTTEAAKAVTDRQNYQKDLYESHQSLHQQPNKHFIIKPMEKNSLIEQIQIRINNLKIKLIIHLLHPIK